MGLSPKLTGRGRSWEDLKYSGQPSGPLTYEHRNPGGNSGMGYNLSQSSLPLRNYLNDEETHAMAVQTYSSLKPHGNTKERFSRNKDAMENSSRLRSGSLPPERIELPSIRKLLEEVEPPSIHPGSQPGKLGISPLIKNEHPPSSPPSHKRRKVSDEDESALDTELLTKVEPNRLSPLTFRSMHTLESSPIRRASVLSTGGSYPGTATSSPFSRASVMPQTLTSPSSFDSMNRAEWKPNLPNLPPLSFVERGPPQGSQVRNSWSEFVLESRSGTHTFPQTAVSAFNPPNPSYQAPPYSYGYQPPRNQIHSGPTTASPMKPERSPFSATSYHATTPGVVNPYPGEINDNVIDNKQRKRRGNLPKETTDQLRSWFVTHIQHPYPTEDEKQELMRITGLAMNQISNWFINARRRQLPAMINNARAESDARSSGGGEARINDYRLSDEEYEEDYDRVRAKPGPVRESAENKSI